MLQPGWPISQRFKSSGLVWASHTRLAGASNMRMTTTSRSDGVCTSTGSGIGSVHARAVGLQGFEQGVETAVVRLSEFAVALDPHVGLLQRLGLDPGRAALGVAA